MNRYGLPRMRVVRLTPEELAERTARRAARRLENQRRGIGRNTRR